MTLWKWLLAIALAGGCLALLFAQVSAADLSAAFHKVSPLCAIVGFVIVVASYLLKALRFKVLLGGSAPFGRLLGVTIAQNVIGQVIPARAGDISYVALVRMSGMASVGYGLATLLLCRFADLLVILAMYLYALGALDLEWPTFRILAYVVGAFMIAGAAVLLALIVWRQRVVAWTERLLKLSLLLRLRSVRYLWSELTDALPHVAALSWRAHILPMILLSAAIWTVTAFSAYVSWLAVGVSLDFAQALFIFSFTNLIGLFPVFFFYGIGTGDVMNTGVLKAFGRVTADATAFSLCNRALSVLYQAVLVLVALVLLGGRLRQAPETPGERKTVTERG
jgi:glycosyltransferase 2 family protein